MTRGIKWLVVGVILIVISYIVGLAANDYVMSGNLGQTFGRIQKMQGIFSLIRLVCFAGIAVASAGGVMCIVESSPNKVRGV